MRDHNAEREGGERGRAIGRVGPTWAATRVRGTAPDIVEVLIRDLRRLVRVVDGAVEGPSGQGSADLEAFDRFIVDAVVYFAVEAAIVSPVITEVLERHDLVDARRSDIHLLVRRMRQARDHEAVGASPSRMRAVKVDLAEHAQTTELGLLSHAYRIYDAAARRTFAERYPQATAAVHEAVRGDGGADLPGVARLDRDLITHLEGVASEALDVERVSTPPSTKAVPTIARRRQIQRGPAPRSRTAGPRSTVELPSDA